MTKEAFPGVDFSLVETVDDVMWERVHKQQHSEGEYDEGESEDACTLRGIKFLKWLMTRHAHILVPCCQPVKKSWKLCNRTLMASGRSQSDA